MSNLPRPPREDDAPSTATPEPAEPTTTERLDWMRKNSRTTLAALGVTAAAAALATFSLSLYTSSTANPGNTVATGIMQQTNSKDGSAILTAAGLLPGETATGDVTITNVGGAAGDFTLSAHGLTDQGGTGSADLSSELQLTVIEQGASKPVYDGTLAGYTTQSLGTWADGASHTFDFVVTFPKSAGDEFQDASSSVDFTWDAVQH